jgi:hypothetical protein
MGLLHRDCAHWSGHQNACDRRCNLIGSTIELSQSFALHLRLHRRIPDKTVVQIGAYGVGSSGSVCVRMVRYDFQDYQAVSAAIATSPG